MTLSFPRIGKSGWLGDVLVALSTANLCMMVSLRWLYVEPDNYFLLPAGQTWQAYLSIIPTILLLAIPLLATLRIIRASRSILLRSSCLLILFIYFLLTCHSARYLIGFSTPTIINFIMENQTIALLLLAAILALSARYTRHILAVVYFAYFILAPYALLTTAQVIMRTVHTAQTVDDTNTTHRLALSADGIRTPKTVFIVFDELDHNLLFEKKYETGDLDLKNFSYLKNHSLFFSDVPSMWMATFQAMPAITVGQQTNSKAEGRQLWITFPDSANKEDQMWQESDNFISNIGQEKKLAVVGDHHHYCTMFADYLHDCIHRLSIHRIDSLREGIFFHLLSLSPRQATLRHIQSLKFAEGMLLTMLDDSEIDFVYAHIMTPHRPYIYNPERQSYNVWNFSLTYQDNLRLVDKRLGDIIGKLKQNGVWNESTLIITSDHYCRFCPDNAPYKPKIPLLIKLPGQDSEFAVHEETPPTKIKSIVEKIVLDREHDPERLLMWLRKQAEAKDSSPQVSQ